MGAMEIIWIQTMNVLGQAEPCVVKVQIYFQLMIFRAQNCYKFSSKTMCKIIELVPSYFTISLVFNCLPARKDYLN